MAHLMSTILCFGPSKFVIHLLLFTRKCDNHGKLAKVQQHFVARQGTYFLQEAFPTKNVDSMNGFNGNLSFTQVTLVK